MALMGKLWIRGGDLMGGEPMNTGKGPTRGLVSTDQNSYMVEEQPSEISINCLKQQQIKLIYYPLRNINFTFEY